LEDKLVNDVYVTNLDEEPLGSSYFFLVMNLAEKHPDGSVETDSIGVKLSRGALRKIHEEVVKRLPPDVNTKALAGHLEISERKARNLRATVRAANSPKEGGTEEMSTTIIPPQLDRIELRQTMQGEKLDHILSVLLAFSEGETPAEAWADWLSSKQDN
jgi:hypothetical protein